MAASVCDDAIWQRVRTAKFGDVLSLEDARTVLFRCNSFSRLPRLIDMGMLLEVEVEDWLRLLGEFWSISDNIGSMAQTLLTETPFGDAVDDAALRPLLMDDSELAALSRLPDELTLYRGCYDSNKWGLSWSLDRAVAGRFPTLHRYRQEGQPLLVTAKARKADVVALKLDRDEAEIIVPRGLRHVSTMHIPA